MTPQPPAPLAGAAPAPAVEARPRPPERLRGRGRLARLSSASTGAAVVTWVLLGALILGGIGFLSTLVGRQYAATGLIAVRPDPPLLDDPGNSPDDTDRFIQSQLLALNSRQLRDQVARKLGLGPDAALTAVQAAATNIVQVTGTAESAGAAERMADTAITTYAQAHRAEVQGRSAAALRTVNQQITAIEAALNSSATTDARRTALSAEYSRLLALRNQLGVSAADAGRSLTVVETAQAAGAHPAAPPARRTVLFALLGAVLALGAAIARRRRSPRVVTAVTAVELDQAPLLPALPRASAHWPRALRDGRPLDDGVEQAVQLQLGQLTGGSATLGRPPLMLISATRGAGTSFAAVALAAQAARRQGTLLIQADPASGELLAVLGIPETQPGIADAPPGPWSTAKLRGFVVPTPVDGLYVLPAGTAGPQHEGQISRAIGDGLLNAVATSAWGAVIDAPPLAESTAGLVIAPAAGQILFIVGIGITTHQEVTDGLRTLESSGASVTGLVVNRPRSRRRRANRR